jgi:hypothetical protein
MWNLSRLVQSQVFCYGLDRLVSDTVVADNTRREKRENNLHNGQHKEREEGEQPSQWDEQQGSAGRHDS